MLRKHITSLVFGALVALALAGCVQSEMSGGQVSDSGTNSTEQTGVNKNSSGQAKAPDPCTREKGVLAHGAALVADNFRDKPSVKSGILRTLIPGERMTITGIDSSFYQVIADDGTKGFVHYSLLGVDIAPCEILEGAAMKPSSITTSPDAKSSVVAKIKAGQTLSVIARNGETYEISSSAGEGFVPARTVLVDPTKQTTARRLDEKLLSNLPLNLGDKDKPASEKSADTPESKQVSGNNAIPATSVDRDGYSKDFEQFRDLYRQCRFRLLEKRLSIEDASNRAQTGTTDDFADSIGLLGTMERGVIALDSGKLTEAKDLFGGAEAIMTSRDEESYSFSGLKKTLAFIGETATGNEQISAYSGPGYERVMLLGYKALSYLLEGDRSAYNVTRRAIDLQNEERKNFEEALAKSNEELKKKQAEQKTSETKNKAAKENEQPDIFSMDFSQILSLGDKKQDERAKSVPSAFVNPFSDYLNAMVLEIDGYQDPAQRSNAAITYAKGLELAPACGVLKKAVQDLNRPAPAGNKLVHIILADGLAPHKQVKTTYLPLGSLPIPLKQGVYVAEESPVAKALVVAAGKSHPLDRLADFEAMALRYEKDAQPLQQLRIGTNLVRSVATQAVLTKTFGTAGTLGAAFLDSMACPDTRSWETLPSTIAVQRLLVPNATKSVKVVIQNDKGATLDSVTVPLQGNGVSVIYCRSLGGKLLVQPGEKTWI